MRKLKDDACHKLDKLGLFALAGLVTVVLGIIVAGTYWTKGVPDKGDVLLGGIATGLILFLRDIVAAVRAGWEEVTRSEVNEQLSKSAIGTQDVRVVNTEANPAKVEEQK